VFFFLIISFEISSSARNKSKTNSTASGSHFCDRDRGEILFKAQAVILARVKSLTAKDRSTEVMVKVAQVWKEREQGLILPKEQLLLKFEPTVCRRLKKGKKYVFSLDPQRAGDVHSGELIEKTSNGEVWKPSGPPMSHSSRVKQIRAGLLCANCNPAPVLRQTKPKIAVKTGGWRRLPCRLSGKNTGLRVNFSWTFEGRRVRPSKRRRVKTRSIGSVLNVRGSSRTAGSYTCTASSLAGTDNLTTTLYVHGRSARSVCKAGYCLNEGTCAVAIIAPGEHQPVCSCSEGFKGARCQLKHVQTTIPSYIVVTIVCLSFAAVIVTSTWWITTRLRHLEAQIVGPTQFPVQNGQFLDKHGQLNINIKDQQPSSRMDRSGRILDIINGVDAVDMKDILDAVDGVDVMDSVGNSASSNFLPKQISSSLSSGLSVGSVKTRRPNAPSGLTLVTPVQATPDSVAFQSELVRQVNSKVEESWLNPNLTTKMVSPGPSPLYVEPWDSKWNTCVHGHSGDGVCQTCEVEAELIVQQCNQWADSDQGPDELTKQ